MSLRYQVEHDPSTGCYLVFYAGKLFATATSPGILGGILRGERVPKIEPDAPAMPAATDRDLITEWLKTNEPTICPLKAVAKTTAVFKPVKTTKPVDSTIPRITLTLGDLIGSKS